MNGDGKEAWGEPGSADADQRARVVMWEEERRGGMCAAHEIYVGRREDIDRKV
jgi:hypothetical protein